MKRSNSFRITTAFLGGLLLLCTISNSSLANTNNVRQGLPGRRISGGSRSPNTACLLDDAHSKAAQKVIAIAPESNLNQTATARPTFWFALPAINPDRSIEFSLVDQAEETVHTQTLQPTGRAGLTAITLPATALELDENQTYKWHLSVVCDRASRATDLVVWGWIERTTGQSAWNDRLTALANLYRERTVNEQTTEDLEDRWMALLVSENLSQSLGRSSLVDIARDPTGINP